MVLLAISVEGKGVAVLEIGSGLPTGELQRLGAAPGKFEQTAVAIGLWAADGSRCAKIADLKVTSIAGMVGELLTHIPVKVFIVGLANSGSLTIRRLNPGFQDNVEGSVSAGL